MTDNDNRRWLYEQMQKNGYNAGTYEEFDSAMNDKANRDWVYQQFSGLGYNMGSTEEFEKAMMGDARQQQATKPSQPPAATTPAQQGERRPYQMAQGNTPTYNYGGQMPPEQRPTKSKATSKPTQTAEAQPLGPEKFAKQMQFEQRVRQSVPSPEAMMQDFSQRMDAVRRDGRPLGGDASQPFGGYEDVFAPARRQRETEEAKAQNRVQVSTLKDEVSAALNERGQQLDSEAMRTSLGDRPMGGGALVHTFNSSTVNGRYGDERWKMLNAANNALANAEKMIREADTKGGVHDWAPAELVRGFEKVGDPRTWDFGLTEGVDATALMGALDKADRGETLTREEQMLLDAKAVEMATKMYYESGASGWYKAGEVTADAIPYMLEFMINPAAKAGRSAQSILTRYALKRFGKEALKTFGKDYLKGNAMRFGGRALADVAGSGVMNITTGMARVAGGTVERANGQVRYATDTDGNSVFAGRENQEDPTTAFMKSLGSGWIEQHSELFGAYFAPLFKGAGKLIKGGMLSKAGKAMRLDRVYDAIDNISHSDWAKVVADFEKNAQWHGPIEEWGEEMVGGIENAIIVGDQTLDADSETGVFNRENMLETLRSVAVMGGVFAAAKTAGYRTPKHQGKRAMTAADDAALAAFGGDQYTWGGIRNTIAFGSDEDALRRMNEVMTDPNISPEQKKAALDYYKAAYSYKGMLAGDGKRKADGAVTPEQEAAEEAFDNGYDADEEGRRDIMIEAGMGEPTEARQAAADGVRQRIEDDADMEAEGWREEGRKMMHSDGSMRPAVLKVKNENGEDTEVYIVEGNVQMMADGTMVDPETSDRSVVIYDPATGERKMIDPTSDMGILSIGEATSAEDFDYEIQRRRDEYVQRMLDEAQGTVRVELGQPLTMPDGREGTVMAISPDGESFTVVANDGSGKEVRMERSDLQQIADAAALADYQARHQEDEATAEQPTEKETDEPTAVTPGTVEGAPTEFLPDMDITILDDAGKEQPATVMGIVRYERGKFVPDETGNIVEYVVDGQVKHENTAKLAEKVVSHVDANLAAQETAAEQPAAVEQPTVETPTAEVETPAAEPVVETTGTVAEQPTVEPMPMREDGEADFLATTPERGHQFIYNEAGLSREEAGQFVKANLETATKALDKAKKDAPKMGTSLVKYKQQQAEHQAKVDAAQQAVDYWQGVKATQSAIVSAEMAEQAERDRVAHEAAVLAEQQRQAEEIAKREEQAALGSNAVAPQIVEKWQSASKLEGAANEITLADGSKVKGHYVIVESGAATPSHNPNMGFVRNDGFPIDENGQTVNDRDYERDQDAQQITRQMADSYDSRAIQNVPVVSPDGVVLSGNGRTMAGELAAQQGTDGEYIDHLKKYPQQFGFEPQQFEGMAHPRLLFVADEAMPYTTETFAKFNQQDMKSQSRTEQSVKMGKTVDNNTFGRIIRSINSFDSLADFYNDPVAASNAIGELHGAGAINNMQLADMMDGEKVSGNGRQTLENMLIGKAFESNPDAIRQLAEFPAMRQSVVSALAEIANNIRLGEDYSLESELAQAINLAYQARKNGVKAGEKVSWFARQQSLFPFDTGETVADYTNATVLMLADCINDSRVSQLKKVLDVYNQKAESSAAGQYNIFSGVINNKSDILKEVTDLFDYGTEQEQQSALDNAVEQRKQAAAVQQPGGEESVPEGSTVEGSDAGSVAEEVTEPQLTEDHGQTERPETDRRDTGDRLRDAVPGGAQRGDNGVDIGSLAEGLAAEQSGDRGRSQREDEEAVGHQIIENAKKSGVFIDRSTLNSFGERVRKPSGESVVYVDDANNRVVKVKDPYAKDNLKGHAASDALYEHIVHNLLFPNTPYRLIGISDNSIGDVRFVLEQDIIDLTTPAIQQDIDWYLINELGLTKVEKPYLHYENDYYSITDVEASGDNVFIDGDGAICFIDPIIKFKKPAQEVINYLTTGNAIAAAEAEVDTNPTEGQKEAGNYKKGHLKLDGYDITIEQPKGSIRRGTDDNGKQWEQEMHNTYGYIRGTEGVDGDHIDVFLSDDPTSGDVFVVDQVDQMGIFDEHKVMYGFPDIESAKAAYLSNYEEGWQGLGAITPVSKEEFKKWIESSHRKTKPFAEYASVKTNGDTQLGEGSPYARYHREAEAEIQQLLDAAPDRTGPVASPERTEAIQKIADMLNEADSAIEDLELNDDQLQRFQARRDAAEKWLEENVYGEGVALSVEDLKEASNETAAVQQTEQPAEAEASDTVAEEVVEQPKEEVKKSKWVDDEDAERFEALRRRMRELNGHLNMGVNPEQLAIGVEMSYYVIKHGAHKFADYAKQMIDALGEWVRPYLKSFYNGARDLPEMEAIDNELTPFDEVRSFDVMNFDKEGPKDIIAMADEVVREREADRQAEEATAKLKQQRKERRKKAIVDEGPNLFTDIEDTTTEQPKEEKPLNNNNNETTDVQPRTSEKGRGRHKPQQDGALGEGAGNETVRPDGGRVDRRDKAHPGTDGVGSEGVSGEVKSEQVVEQPKRNLNNNHAERGTDYAPKDVDKRIAANIAAIEKMQELMESGQQATPEDMAVLRKFSGWGGLGKAFQETGYGYGYDPTATSKRLKALLGDEAYEQANMSRNSAYYTPAKVIDALWDIARAMGFKGGKVLEGSAGIGNIIGLMPQDMSEKSDIHAVEIDSTTGNILKLLYPDAKVDVQGFEATEIENGSVDLAITNVPFVTGLRVNDTTGDKDLSKKFRDIHDFCIAKNVRKLREGGIGIFITSSGTLDNSAKLREWIVQDGGADVVGAFRLNNETFGGTGATSDIIVIRKRVNGKKSAHAIDVLTTTGERTAEYDTGEMKKVKGEFVDVVKQLSLDYNKYFVEHPEMMGGEMGFAFEHGDDYRATSKGLYPKKGINQEERLAAFVKSMEGMDDEASAESKIERVDYDIADALEEDSRWKGDLVEGRLFIDKEGRICMAQRATAVPLEVNANKVKGHTKQECLNAYTDIRDALDAVLKYQTENDSDEGLQPLLDALNNAYDQFVSTYGHLHKNTAISFLKNDVDFANILALEKFSERGDVKTGKRIYEYGKTDIFSQRVVEKEKAPEPTNVKDGIISSIYVHGRVDVPWIASMISQHTGKGITEAQVKEEIISSGLGFENPATRQMEVSYDYLSGNVREKLAQAQQSNSDGRYDANIKALEDVIPMNIPSHLIDFSIGSSWIDPKLYEDYVKEKTDIDVTLTLAGGTWFMKKPGWVNEEKNRSFGIVSQMLNKTIMGTDLIEAAMQNRTITVSETRRRWDGSTETVTDKDATTACANKIDEIRQDFKDWARGKMQSDAAMSEHIERIYNEMFNNYVPKSIPDDFVPEHFGGAATMVDGKPFALRPHQGKAVVRGTTQPLLLAHEVGTGKTYTLITTAMEMRRLGTARKPMIVVQNATVGQFVESAKKLYPNAKVLTIEDKDHTAEGRKNFYAKIKYNDWDMIVVPQSVFERIPDSEERQMAFVSDKIEEKELMLEQMKEADPDGSSMIVRQAEKEIEKLNEEMGVLTGFISEKRKEKDAKKAAITRQNAEVKALEMLDRQTDDVENFDDMGIDALLVDEAHEYKHLGFATAMQRGVKGVDPSYSKKAQGVYLKTQAVMEKNNGRNVVFATGTPISNTAAEIWTFMRYLMPADTMREYGIYYFDDFVRNFGNLTQMLEFTTSGKFKENNRFAGYVNLPELVRIWSGIADTVLTAEAGGVSDKIPDMEGGKAQDIYLPQTKALRSVMKYVKAELERFEKMTGKQKKENSHIPLTMYGIAKAAAVDARLVVADAADDPQSKTNEAVRQTLRSLEDTKDYKGTVALFADNYQNSKTGFNLYEDIREKLIAAGVPEEQIVVMKSGMSVKKKLEIFDMVNRGDVRVIMGSTFTLGTGVNIQERLHTLIHLDAPNRPMDYTQRNGRILRQGNLHKEMNKPVRVLRFGVEDSLDVTAYQRLKTKGAIADSIMNGKQMMSNSMENRVLEEEEDVFGDTVAQLSGSEYAMLKNQAEKDVRKYENKKKQWEADQTYCHNEIPRLESRIRQAKIRLEDVKKALEKVEEMAGKHPEATITVDKKKYDSIDAMSDYIKEFNKKIRDAESDMRENPYKDTERKYTLKVNIGGFDFLFTTNMSVETTSKQGTLFSAVHRKMVYSCDALGLEDVPVKQSLLREGLEDIVQNVITGNDFRERIEITEKSIARNEASLAQVRERDGKPFGFVKELEAAHKHLDEYTELMKKEMEEKEKKYAEMDAEVEEAVDLSEAQEADEEEEDNALYRMREDAPPTKTGIGYKVFVLKNGQLYPPMVANPNGAATPVCVWLNADAAPVAGTTKTGRQQVKAGGKGTQGGSGKLAYRPGWHLGEIPYASQFNRLNPETGVRDLFPANFVWAEVEYADDVDYNEEAKSHGMNANGKYQHSLAGLPRVPENGSYKYRTNPDPTTDPWIITGAMKVNRILTPSEVDAMVEAAGREPQERQAGAVTDEEVNALNEELKDNMREGEGPVAPSRTYEEGLRAARSVGYSKKQYDAMLERSERNARKRFADIVEKLNLTDRVEIRDTAEGLKGKKANAKGWYDPDTGKIVVILGNHESADDVVKTILHEGVGHHGLRELFGKHFDQFLDNVYEAADEYVRGKIYAIAEKHGYDFRKATEEYLADMAMDTDFEHPDSQEWWMKIKQLFWEMLHKLGMKVKDWSTTISDNELRYLLWRSYMNLTEPGRYRSLVEQAEDTLMQKKLKVGVFEEASQPESSDTEQSQKVLKAAEPVEDAIAKMRKERPDTVFLVEVGDHYEARGEDAKQMSQVLGINPTKSGVVRIAKDDINKYLLRMVRAGQRVALAGEMTPRAAEDRELFRDGDFSERDRAIARDAYERMVASSGYQFKEAMQDSMLGLRKAYEAILGGKKFRIEEVAGNENAYLAENRMSSVNAAEQTAYFREWMQPLLREIHKICGDDAASRKQLTDYMMAKHGLERNEKFAERDAKEAAKNGADYNKEYQNNRKKDYSGLTALTGNAYTAAAEAAAQQMVADFEADHDTTALWEKVNDATKTTLAKIYLSGMLSEESYEQIRDMFDYYIPLRGWDETTSDEVYGYLTSKDGPLRGSTIKHAYGRSSKADDPIATIGLMADTAIRQANRNEMKQRFLTFALNHPSDLVSVNKLWLQYDATNDEWVPVFADIKADDSAYDVERKVKAFEARMEALAAADPDNYKSGEDAKNIPYKVVKGNVSEHQVLVKRGGVTYVLTINGNPRAAQALNGLTNPDVETAGVIGNMLKGAEYINRQLSAFYTTRTPDFIVSNFFRDMLYSNCMTWVKENPRYALTFHKNFGKVNPATMRVLFGKWEKGTLDDSKTLEHQFKIFMMNGGETGYTNVKDIEGKKKEIVAELKRQGNVSRKAWHALGMQLDLLNRSVENCARFAAFITSQELGRSIERSIYDAKEVSVNFNKKGSGGKMVNANGQTGLGKMGSYMSGAGRLFYVFWNAGVQGMTNFGRAAKRHPGKFTAGAASMFALGAVIPLLAQALGGDDDDDKNAYYNLPEYVRRSNICFRAGDQWITIPLPIEFRAIYGMGELATGVISGNEDYSDGELARQMTSQVSQILPLDFMEGGGGLHAFIPSVAKPLVEAANNKGWTGLPIYKDTPWNQNDPEFTKVYKSADKYIVGASRWLNEFTGGDDYKKGWADVVNPAQVEYVLNGYFGGYFKVPNQLVKMAETAFGDREFEWRNMMIANRLVKSGDERTAHRKLQNEYFKYKEEYEETKRLKKKYEQAANDGVVGYAEKVDFLNNSEEYARYLIFDQYRKQINDLYKLQKDEPDAEKRRVYEEEYYHVMREMVDAMHEYEKGKGK